LPRKWSIRKTWLSSNVSWTWSLSAIALQVGAEGLLHDDAGALDEPGLAQHRDDVDRGLGGHGQVVQSAHVRAQLGLRLRHGLGQRLGAGCLGHVRQGGRELVPLLLAQRPVGELVERLLGEGPEALGVEVVQRGGHEPHLGRQL
jgi:hypothetical protein